MVTARREQVTLAPGYRTTVVREGAGPVVVLVHGTPLDLRSWDLLVPFLSARRQVLRYDARGHGSATDAAVPGYGALADDLVVLLDLLDVDRVHLVGHSWGGQIVQRFALEHPDRLHRLSLVCTRSAPFPAFAAVAARLRSDGADVEGTLARWLSPAALARRNGVADTVRTWLATAPAAGWAAAMDMVATFDVRAELSRIHVPVDVVAAEDDAVATPEHMTEMADALPDSRLVLVRGARHLVPLEQPAAVARVLLGDGDGARESDTAPRH